MAYFILLDTCKNGNMHKGVKKMVRMFLFTNTEKSENQAPDQTNLFLLTNLEETEFSLTANQAGTIFSRIIVLLQNLLQKCRSLVASM